MPKLVKDGYFGDLDNNLQKNLISVHKVLKDMMYNLLENEKEFKELNNDEWAKSKIDEFLVGPTDKNKVGSIRAYNNKNKFSCMIQITGHFENMNENSVEQKLNKLINTLYERCKNVIKKEYNLILRSEYKNGESFEGFDVWLVGEDAKKVWDLFEFKKVKEINKEKELDESVIYEKEYEYKELPNQLKIYVKESIDNIKNTLEILCEKAENKYYKENYDLSSVKNGIKSMSSNVLDCIGETTLSGNGNYMDGKININTQIKLDNKAVKGIIGGLTKFFNENYTDNGLTKLLYNETYGCLQLQLDDKYSKLLYEHLQNHHYEDEYLTEWWWTSNKENDEKDEEIEKSDDDEFLNDLDDDESKKLQKYVQSMMKKMGPSLNKCLDKYPEYKSMFSVYDKIDDYYWEEYLENGYIWIVGWDLWEYNETHKDNPVTRSNDLCVKVINNCENIMDELVKIVNDFKFGNASWDGDWDDWYIEWIPDIDLLKKHLKIKDKKDELKSESMLQTLCDRLSNDPTQSNLDTISKIFTEEFLPKLDNKFNSFEIQLLDDPSLMFEVSVSNVDDKFINKLLESKDTISNLLHNGENKLIYKISPMAFKNGSADDIINFLKESIIFYSDNIDIPVNNLIYEYKLLPNKEKYIIEHTDLKGILPMLIESLFIDNNFSFKESLLDNENILSDYLHAILELENCIDNCKMIVESIRSLNNYEVYKQIKNVPILLEKYHNKEFNDLEKQYQIEFENSLIDNDWHQEKDKTVEYYQEGFFSKVKKLKKFPSDLIAYITIETEAIRDYNDKLMIASYTASKLEICEWYIELLDIGSKNYIVPYTKDQLQRFRTQLLNCYKKIMNVKIVNPNQVSSIDDMGEPYNY